MKVSSQHEVLLSFISYFLDHPEELFWQALRNWSGYNFVLVANHVDFPVDTFYWKGKSS